MLNLHFVEKDISVFCKFDLPRTSYKHFQCTLGAYNESAHCRIVVPKFVFRTSCIPEAAVIWTAIACCFLMYSAFGLSRFKLDI